MAKRRDKGTGGIYQRPDGKWVGTLNIGYTENGNPKRKTVVRTRKSEVVAELERLRAEYATGVQATNQTVQQYLDTWLMNVVSELEPRTQRSYADTVRKHIVPHIGKVKLTDLSAQHVQMMITKLRKNPELGQRSVQYAYSVLSRALNRAVKLRLVSQNVAQFVDTPKVEKKQKRALTPDEVKQLLAAAQGHRLEWLYHVAVTLGLRKGELVNLRWSDLALDSSPPTLTVQRGKTPAAHRTIALSPELVAGLRQHWQNQVVLRAAKDVEWIEHGYVFPSEVGTKTSERNLDRHFKSALQAAGLADVPFHWLRHTALTRLAEANTPPAVLKTIAGHKRFATTAEIYVHVAADQQQECIAKMSALYA